MFLIIALVVLIILFILFRQSYNKFASGLRERPQYFLWLLTRYINFKGWTTEEYCLRTNDLQSNGSSGYLSDKDIPVRNQSRPKMLRATPHRQLTQQAPDDIMYEMYKYIESISIPKYGGETLDDKLLLRGESTVEYTGAYGIFLSNASQKSFEKGEVAHIHSNDGSFHMILHPSDVKLLIEKQRGERFPLAGHTLFNITLSSTYFLVYAPQNKDEIKIWKTILHAAIDYNRDHQKKN